MAYDVHLEIFEGPLDLLLYLIRKNDLEISEIPISQITKEYIAYIEVMKDLNLEIAGEFLVMASTLMQIKARMLLPVQEKEEDEGPDPLEDLKARLFEYQKYKEAAKELSQREAHFSDVYYRSAPTFEKDDYVLDVSLFDLLNSFRDVLKELPNDVKEIVYQEMPIEEKIRQILDMFETSDFLTFEDILKTETTKIGLILTFLAMLELIRLKQIIARQTGPFGKIRVYRVKEEETSAESEQLQEDGEKTDDAQEELLLDGSPNVPIEDELLHTDAVTEQFDKQNAEENEVMPVHEDGPVDTVSGTVLQDQQEETVTSNVVEDPVVTQTEIVQEVGPTQAETQDQVTESQPQEVTVQETEPVAEEVSESVNDIVPDQSEEAASSEVVEESVVAQTETAQEVVPTQAETQDHVTESQPQEVNVQETEPIAAEVSEPVNDIVPDQQEQTVSSEVVEEPVVAQTDIPQEVPSVDTDTQDNVVATQFEEPVVPESQLVNNEVTEVSAQEDQPVQEVPVHDGIEKE